MKPRIPILALILIGSSLSPSWAETYYVAPAALGGNDANAGTLAQPWLTVEKAAATLIPGDTVLIRGGTYSLSQGVKPARSGTSGNPITFKSYPGEIALADGGNHGCFDLGFRSYITFDGLKMTSANAAGGASIVYMENTNHCSFLNCEFYGLPVQSGAENTSVIRCIAGAAFSTNCTFRNNLFRDNAAPCMRLFKTDGWVIENNEFRNSPEFVGGKEQSRNMLVRRNLFVNCSGTLSGGSGVFMFAGQNGSDNVTITENIAYNCEKPVFQLGGQGTGGAYRQNTKFYNNTFYECRSFIMGWDGGFTTDQNYYNNIVYSITSKNIPGGADTSARLLNIDRWGSTPMSAANYYMDYNCLSIPAGDSSMWFNNAGTAFYSLASWKSARPPFEAHSISANPLFVNAAGGNFHLQPGSPCIGTGRNGENMGAYPRGNDGTIIGRFSGDVVAPTVSISAPSTGATVSGSSVLVTAVATDNAAVAGVQFKLDGIDLGAEDTTLPYGVTWNTLETTNGSHVLSAVARDTAGLSATATSPVTVSNAGPEINVTGKGVAIPDGANSPRVEDATAFDSVNVANGSITQTYTIQNQGGSSLLLGSVTISGAQQSDFTVLTQPATTIAPGASSTFRVKFDPSGVGIRRAYLSLGNNDPDENPYDFAILGSGDIIVDNADSTGVQFLPNSAAWQGSTSVSGYYGNNYLHDGDAEKGTRSVRFTPLLPEPGTYAVYGRWTTAANRARNVPLDVATANGVHQLEVDQQLSGGTWVPLGRFPFNSGTTGSVLLSNAGTSGHVIADAFKFVLEVVNPGFESNAGGSQTIIGWTETGANPSASFVASSAAPAGGTKYLGHWSSTPYEVVTSQTRTGLSDGDYTLKARIQRSGAQTTAQMEASGFGGATRTVSLPVSTTWTTISITGIEVRNGTCTFGFRSVAPGGALIRVDEVEFYKQ